MKKNLFALTLTILILNSCNQPSFSPSDTPNPWLDDYSKISNIQHYKEWGTYNVHDPAGLKEGEYFYIFSTDAIYAHHPRESKKHNVPEGHIQIRRTKDLVNWEFVGWAFSEIPQEAIEWVHSNNNKRGATNIWAPYVVKTNNQFRLYYSVSAFGKNTSYIGLAESSSLEGPWINKGAVVKTNRLSLMNAIDPSIITDNNNRMWMHYGSYFGGLYCVELDPETGLTKKMDDQGHLIARRANYKVDNLEAPEIIYNKKLNAYYLFTSYDPLMTTYNIRVAKADAAEGPFYDFFGENIKDTTNNYPIITAPYKFSNHQGWAGVGHCGIIKNNDEEFFMIHQGRLSPDNHQMVLHVRQVFFTEDGWPVVSPERYAGTNPIKFKSEDIDGEWEIIRIREPEFLRGLEVGQVLPGEGSLFNSEWNISSKYSFCKNIIKNKGEWSFNSEKQVLDLHFKEESIHNIIVFAGQDWENQKETILFTGLDNQGRSIWGKRIK